MTSEIERAIAAIGPEPYYEHAGITIYHGDCAELLPFLGERELIITDPPYGIDYQSSWRTGSQRKAKIHGDLEFPFWIFTLEVQIALYVWCRWDVMRTLPIPKSYIVWDKGNHSMGDLSHEYGRQWEGIAFYPGPKHSFANSRPSDIISVDKVPPLALRHPNEKPVDALEQLILPHHGLIVDPFIPHFPDQPRGCVVIR